MRVSYAALPFAALAAVCCITLSNAKFVALHESSDFAPSSAEHVVESDPHEPQYEMPAPPMKMPKHEVITLVDYFARENRVPIQFARAVVHVESSYNPHATGSVGEIGLMQLKYETARMIGFKGTRDDLYEPEINLTWGMKYLAGAWKLGGQTLCGAVIRYQGGHARKKHTSVSRRYCEKVRKFMASN